MSLLQLPVNSDSGNYEFKTMLEGIKYIFAFRYNTRMGRWIMDIKSSADISLVAGIPLLIGVDYLSTFQDSRLPPGQLFLLNVEDENTECGRDDLGENVFLMYEESE